MIDCDNDHSLVVAEVRVRLAINKQAAQKFDGFPVMLMMLIFWD
jgi:hypothetical protein